MTFNEKTFFTIGQFASLHGINKKTLMWYDEIDLFKPAVIKENGYRYYTYYQSSTLELILMLKDLNIPLKTIKEYIENRSAENLNDILTREIDAVTAEILRLKKIKKSLIKQKSDVEYILNSDLDEIKIVEKEAQNLIIINSSDNETYEKEIGTIIKELKKHNVERLGKATYGSVISVDNLKKGDFETYCGIFVNIPNIKSKSGITVVPKSKYLRAYNVGEWDKIPNVYKKMLNFAKENKIELGDCSYEIGINETSINSINEYITQIDIRIK